MAKSIAKRAGGGPTKAGRIFIIVFFGIFALFGSFFVWLFFAQPVLGVLSARDWRAVPCTVLASTVESHSDSDGTTYSIEITYEYEVDGSTYTGEAYSFSGGSSSGYKGKQRVVSAHPPGLETVCYVDPNDPSRAVLHRDMTGDMWFGALTLLFPLVGLGAIVGVSIAGRRKDALSRRAKKRGGAKLGAHGFSPRRSASTAAQEDIAPYLPAYDPDQRPLVLRARFARLGKLGFFLLFAAIWNTVVGVFLAQIIESFRQGDPEWVMTLFMIPFVAVGLGVLGYIVYQSLALFNPLPTLTLDEPATPLGGELRFQWRLRGAVRRIDTLTIALVGQEEATYRRGTSTYTDRAEFFDTVLVETRDPHEMRNGEATIAIPEGAMHSLDLANNNINWFFRIEGDIKRWPDIKDELKIVILPREVAS